MHIEKAHEPNKRLFKMAVENRDREIELLWTRSNAMWVIVALCFTAHQVTKDDAFNALIVSTFGIFSSACWMTMIAGSKWWQEIWEAKMQQAASQEEKDFLFDFSGEIIGEAWYFKLRRYSVTKILFTLVCFTFALWLSIFMLDLKALSKTIISDQSHLQYPCDFIINSFSHFLNRFPFVPKLLYFPSLLVIFLIFLLCFTQRRDKSFSSKSAPKETKVSPVSDLID